MAETFAMKLLVAFGLPMFIMGWIADLDPVKSWFAFITGSLLLLIRAVFSIDGWYHAMWMRREERRKIRKENNRK